MKSKLLALIAAATAVFTNVRADDFIAVSATTAPDYQRSLDAQGNPLPEAYVFGEGNFMQGATKDPYMEKYRLQNLLVNLAKNLAKQKYFPASDPNDSDLVIIVHWGATLIHDDPSRELSIERMNSALRDFGDAAAATDGIADPGAVNELSESLAAGENWRNNAIARNAALLGYSRRLKDLRETNSMILTTTERTLREELAQERYFVVLMAYDFKAYKQKKSVLRWITRLSVRSPGNNFGDAVVMLSEAGGNVFGTKLDTLSHVKGKLRQGEVVLGELKVLGQE
jgi:hypothetical protein